MPDYPPSPVATPVPTGGSGNYQPSQPAQPVNPTNPYGGLWNLYQGAVLGPQDALAQQNLGYLGLQSGLLGANYDLQSGYLGQTLGQQLQGIGLSREQLGVQQGALSRQMGPTGLSQQYENLQQQLFGLSHQDIAAAREQAQFQSAQQGRGAWSGATARGATVTSGFRQQLSDIGTQLQERLGGIGREEQRLGVSEEKEKLRFGEEQAQLKDANTMLGIQAKRLNLSEDEVKTRIGNALAQLGINRSLSEVDILKAMNDIENGRYSALGNVLGQIAQIDPGLLQGIGGGSAGGGGAATNYKGASGLNSALQASGQQPLSDSEAWIIQHESGFDTGSKNSSSGAFGLGQLNPSSGTLQSYASRFGYDPHTTDPVQQMNMFRAYVKDRYGTAERAQQFWQAHGWY